MAKHAEAGEAGFFKRMWGITTVRFLVAGALNTLVGYVGFSLLTVAGVSLGVALFAGMVFGTVFNYLTFGGLVFRRLDLPTWLRFIVVYLSIFVCNLALLSETLRAFAMNPLWAQLLLTPFMAALAFYAMKYFVFQTYRRR